MPQKMRVVNGTDYTKSLKERGKIFTLVNRILSSQTNNHLKIGKGECKYSNHFIVSMYTVGYILNLPLRQLCGFFEDYAQQNNYNLDIPNFSTLSRRLKNINLTVIDKRPKYALHQEIGISIDSSTVSIYANTSHHDKQNAKYRKYFRYEQTRKMHISLDMSSKNVNAFLYTKGTFKDHLAFPKLITTLSKANIKSAIADRAYDYELCYQACHIRDIEPIIPPKITAAYRTGNIFHYRNQARMTIQNYRDYETGLLAWKNEKRYGRRSCIETFFSRFKTIFKFSMKNKTEENRQKELVIKCNILNQFNRLGMPKFKLVNED